MQKKKIILKNKEKFIRLMNVISWLDECRWSEENAVDIINYCSDDIKNCEKILTHCLCYITDRVMPFERIWEKGGLVFSELVKEYSKGNIPFEYIEKKYYIKYPSKDGVEKFKFKSDNYEFASHYITNDYECIKQTLQILEDYNRNIVKFIVDILEKYKDNTDLLKRVAFALHLLTYSLNNKKADTGEIVRILGNEAEFNQNFKIFEKKSTNGKKRLWCCIRDYKKGPHHDIFKKAIVEIDSISEKDKEILVETWDKLPMNQIELPGDVWNNNPIFRENLFGDIIEDINNIPKTWGMPKIIRELFEQLSEDEKGEYYPEQFDITFDFVPRMCGNKLCDICLFGKNGIDLICIPSQDKLCPVALISCGYKKECKNDKEDCDIIRNISKGLCKGTD